MGGLVWYNCPPIQEWAAMTFLMRIYWLVWLIGLAAVVYLGVLVLLGVRKHHLTDKTLSYRYNAPIIFCFLDKM